MQLLGHGLLVFWQNGPVAPLHSQQTGGATQPHLPVVSLMHCDPGGNVGGHGPVHPSSVSSWQYWTTVVVVVLVVVVVTVVVVVGCPTIRLSAGAQRTNGLPTGTFVSN